MKLYNVFFNITLLAPTLYLTKLDYFGRIIFRDMNRKNLNILLQEERNVLMLNVAYKKGLMYVMFLKNYKKLRHQSIDISLWIHKFTNLLKYNDVRFMEILKNFTEADIIKVSQNRVKRKDFYSPVLFCVVKNEKNKIKVFLEHYRKLGIHVFVFLDNNSTDGTREYLCGQKDVIVYRCNEGYSSAKRVAWLNRLLAIYGVNRWCMIVDADELVNFIGCEKYDLRDIVRKAQSEGYERILGFMVDMYSDKGLFAGEDNETFVEDNKYFDKNTYSCKSGNSGLSITGGPRRRIMRNEQILSKTPLFYFGREDFIASSHYMLPFWAKNKSPVWLAICHYKFISDRDLERVRMAVKEENYAGASRDYKKYLKAIEMKENISFYKEGISERMDSSEDLRSINILDHPFD